MCKYIYIHIYVYIDVYRRCRAEDADHGAASSRRAALVLIKTAKTYDIGDGDCHYQSDACSGNYQYHVAPPLGGAAGGAVLVVLL